MAPQPKGKQGTKGAKQIVEENVATLKFYRNMAAGGAAIFLAVTFLLFQSTWFSISMAVLSVSILFGAYQFMAFMCKPTYSETGALLDSGSDLNMEGAISEHVKDLIILTTGTILLSIASDWFWLLLLLAPGRATFMLWGSVISPWLNQKSEEPEVDEKKQRKLDKKLKRMR